MPLPKRKHSHARTSQRRANNWKLDVPNVGSCPRCRAPRLSHHVCSSCGFYENRQVLVVKSARQAESGGQGNTPDAQD